FPAQGGTAGRGTEESGRRTRADAGGDVLRLPRRVRALPPARHHLARVGDVPAGGGGRPLWRGVPGRRVLWRGGTGLSPLQLRRAGRSLATGRRFLRRGGHAR